MDELIGIEQDNLGNEIKVYFCKHETMSAKVTAFFLKQWAELIEARFAISNYIPSIEESRVIYLTSDNNIIGLRMWVWEQATTRIILSSIDKNYRRRGLLTILAKHYDNRVTGGDCTKSSTYIHVKNTAMIAAAKKTGYEIELVKMVKKY